MSGNNLVKATMQLPCSVVIVSAKADDRQGAMTASAMFISQVPPKLVVSISKTFATFELIEESKEFAINVISDTQMDLAKKFGSVHGYEVDKLQEFGITTEPAGKIGAPLISGCFANMECQIRGSMWEMEGNHAIYIAEVVSFKMDKELKPVVWFDNLYYEIGKQCKV